MVEMHSFLHGYVAISAEAGEEYTGIPLSTNILRNYLPGPLM